MRLISYILLFLNTFCFYAQEQIFTKKDTLRGSINKNRIWWDVQKYDLSLSIDIPHKSISGTNTIAYKVLESANIMQIDLQSPMQITEVRQNGVLLTCKKIGDAYLIHLTKKQHVDSIYEISIKFGGQPKESNHAPWEGGFTWTKDSLGNDFIATTCQGDGASLWWPNKDHLYDEPENGMDISYTVPKNLVAVGNGRLTNTTLDSINHTKTYQWKVTQPINNYGVQLSIGNYTNYSEQFTGESGTLDCEYYILNQNLQKAKLQFKQVEKMLNAFEYWFGPYPFYKDSYKLVEVPYLGMEHQSAIGYGNDFKNGYKGTDLSNTGWGLKFDFIIIHESGHEWFGNNVTNKDIADMWIHESFTNYSECLYLEYYYGKAAASDYTIGLRKNIQNDKPIIGKYNLNNEGSGDMYYKGANMLHTIRSIINNDETWRSLLRGINKQFYHKTVTTKEIENYISTFTNINFTPVFDQYLRTTEIPTLEYKLKNKSIKYRWINTINQYNMPISTTINQKQTWLKPTTQWQKLKTNKKIYQFEIDKNFYVNSTKID